MHLESLLYLWPFPKIMWQMARSPSLEFFTYIKKNQSEAPYIYTVSTTVVLPLNYPVANMKHFHRLWRRQVTMRINVFFYIFPQKVVWLHVCIIVSVRVEHTSLKCIQTVFVLQFILTSVARPSSFAWPASPRHIAQTMEDLPVPGNTIFSKYVQYNKFVIQCTYNINFFLCHYMYTFLVLTTITILENWLWIG